MVYMIDLINFFCAKLVHNFFSLLRNYFLQKTQKFRKIKKIRISRKSQKIRIFEKIKNTFVAY